jgi:hypothetical protein
MGVKESSPVGTKPFKALFSKVSLQVYQHSKQNDFPIVPQNVVYDIPFDFLPM